MVLLELSTTSGKIYINPEHIASIEPQRDGVVITLTSRASAHVKETLTEIKQLAERGISFIVVGK